MILVKKCSDKVEWDEAVLKMNGHPLQLWGWGEVKAAHGWKASRLFFKRDNQIIGAAQILIRKLPAPFNGLVYVPRGPVLTNESDRGEALTSLAAYVKSNIRAVAVTIEPDWPNTAEVDGWRKSNNTILIPKTLILDLNNTEDELLLKMSKKTRQYIRKSAKNGLEVRPVEGRAELDACLEIYEQTAERAGFAIHDRQYYSDIYEKLSQHSPVLVAVQEGKIVAFLWLAVSQSTAFELYGGVDQTGQDLRANYVLKWEAIRLMKARGVTRYDMNGLLNDGVSNFKRGFANHENELVGTYDKPLSPLYFIWDKGLPTAKKVVRKLRGR